MQLYIIVSSTSSVVLSASMSNEATEIISSTTTNHNATNWTLLGISLIFLGFPLLVLVIISVVSCVCCFKLRRATRHRVECGEVQRRYELSSTVNILNMEENNAYGQIELAQRSYSYCN